MTHSLQPTNLSAPEREQVTVTGLPTEAAEPRKPELFNRAKAAKDRVLASELAQNAMQRTQEVVTVERAREALRHARDTTQKVVNDERTREAVKSGAKVAATATAAALVAESQRRRHHASSSGRSALDLAAMAATTLLRDRKRDGEGILPTGMVAGVPTVQSASGGSDVAAAIAAAVREQHHRAAAARRALVEKNAAPSEIPQPPVRSVSQEDLQQRQTSAQVAAKMSSRLNHIHDSSMAVIRGLHA